MQSLDTAPVKYTQHPTDGMRVCMGVSENKGVPYIGVSRIRILLTI